MVSSSLQLTASKPHLTVRLVLELMAGDSGPQRSSSASSSPPSLSGTAALQHLRALVLASSSCPGCATTDAAHCCSTAAASSSDSSDDDSARSEMAWEDEEESDSEEDRGRLGATVGARALSREESAIFAAEQRRAGETVDSERAKSALDEVDHPFLTGAVAALHGYMASGADIVFLEKAYDMARAVAGSKHELGVAFNACRMALAVGYVYTLKKGSHDSARQFALNHSLPKLALSLKPYWSLVEDKKRSAAEELEWEKCMMSMLEVTSSVSLLSEEKDVLSALDAEAGTGLAEAIGLFCILNPDVLSQYPDVGRACIRRHLSSLGGEQQRRIAAAFNSRAQMSLGPEDKCNLESE